MGEMPKMKGRKRETDHRALQDQDAVEMGDFRSVERECLAQSWERTRVWSLREYPCVCCKGIKEDKDLTTPRRRQGQCTESKGWTE